VQGTFGDIYCI